MEAAGSRMKGHRRRQALRMFECFCVCRWPHADRRAADTERSISHSSHVAQCALQCNDDDHADASATLTMGIDAAHLFKKYTEYALEHAEYTDNNEPVLVIAPFLSRTTK